MTDVTPKERIEGQTVEEYRDRGDGHYEIVLQDGTVVGVDGVWWPPIHP